MTQHDQPILARDPVTGDYIADFRICIPAEFYRRAFYTYCEEENIDLTSLEALATVMARVGAVGKWLTHPQKKITVIPVTRPEVKQGMKQPTESVAEVHRAAKSYRGHVYEQVREKALHVAPYKWEETCLTPTASIEVPPQIEKHWDTFCQWLEKHKVSLALLSEQERTHYWKKYREDVGRLRYDERGILKQLYAEWQRGDLMLDPEAAEQERRYQETQQKNLTMKLETVAGVVNGSRML